MNIVVTFSSKDGLLAQYRRNGRHKAGADIPPDFFAEGDSEETIQAVIDALRSGGHKVQGVEGDDRAAAALRRHRPDLVFNIAEGLFGDFRESYVPMVCEQLGIPYTGSGPLTLAICLNKARAKEILSYYGIPTPRFRVAQVGEQVDLRGLRFPVIVKPVSEGSSKGVFNDSVADTPAQARQQVAKCWATYQQPVLVEEFLAGREFTVAVWGNGDDLEVLPIVEIVYDELPAGARPLYSYEAKWVWDRPEQPLRIFECPAPLADEARAELQLLVKRAYRVLHIRDWCRIDVRADAAGRPHILELNPLPGILPNPEDNSCFPKAARTAGYSYQRMVNHVVEIAAARYGMTAA
ncbi:MAG: ATP-grasp domain-containing protein [bacterium]|jgi:D-alanine-D-alanine ligase|nr:ATP-grasp domain-containing protein [candidate division KSB1 bacterium]MDH7561372.1 ATP-grasp domain-containing protein [bacterium]